MVQNNSRTEIPRRSITVPCTAHASGVYKGNLSGKGEVLGFWVGALCPRGTPSVAARSVSEACLFYWRCYGKGFDRPRRRQPRKMWVTCRGSQTQGKTIRVKTTARRLTDDVCLPASHAPWARSVIFWFRTSAGLQFDTQSVPVCGGGGPARHDSAPAPPSQRVQRQTSDMQVVSSPRQVRFLGPRPCSVSTTRLTVAAPHGFGEETHWVQHPEAVAEVKDSVGPHARQVMHVPRSFSEDPVAINTRKLPLRQSARWPACTEKENPKPLNQR